MTMLGLYGMFGSGKNVFAVEYLKKMAAIGLKRQELWNSLDATERLKKFKGIEPPKIVCRANFHIEDLRSDPPVPLTNISFMTTDEFLNLEGTEGIRYELWIDEPYAWGLEARRSGSDIAVMMTKKSLQSRKTGARSRSGQESGSDIGYSTQLPSSMDKRLKYLARSVLLAMSPDEWGYHYLYMGRLYRVLHISMTHAKSHIFPFYDTYEKIEVTYSEDYYKAAGVIDEGRKEDAIQIERGVRGVMNDQSMITKDGVRIWKSLVNPVRWEDALKEGGKIEQLGNA